MDSAPEAELIARCRRGDAAAWDQLFQEHYPAAGRFVFQLSSDFSREDVEEICQETFLSVVRSLESFHGRCRFQTWLFRICANKARDFHQRHSARKRGGGVRPESLHAENPETGLTLDPPSEAPGPDAQLSQLERSKFVHESLGELGPACREIIELRYFGDLSYEELAAELQLNQKTVSSRLSKCLTRLEEVIRLRCRRENSTPFSV